MESFYLENEGLVYYVLQRECPALLKDEDAVQEAKKALWIACTKFDKERAGSFATYAYTLIRNALFDHIKHEKKQIENGRLGSVVSLNQVINDEKSDNAVELGDIIQADIEDDGPFVSSDKQTVFFNALKCCGLSKVEYDTCMKLLRGMSQTEIAEQEGCVRQAVNNRLRKIKSKIIAKRELFEGLDFYF